MVLNFQKQDLVGKKNRAKEKKLMEKYEKLKVKSKNANY